MARPQEAASDVDHVNNQELFLLWVHCEATGHDGWWFLRSVTEIELLSPENMVAAASSCSKTEIPFNVFVPATADHPHPCITVQPFAIWCEDMITDTQKGSADIRPIPPPPPMPAQAVNGHDAVPGGQKRGGWGPL